MGKNSKQKSGKNKKLERILQADLASTSINQEGLEFVNNELKEFTEIGELRSLLKIAVCELALQVDPNKPFIIKNELEDFQAIHEKLQKIMKLDEELMALKSAVKGNTEDNASLKNATAADRLENADEFYKWAIDNGVVFSGVRIAEFPGYGLGLQATRDLEEEEPLFAIPRKMILSEETLRESLHASVKDMTHLSNLRLVYILLMHRLEKNSFWKPYIEMLPSEYTTVLYYSVDEMSQLQGTAIFSSAIKFYKSIVRQYCQLYTIMLCAPEPDNRLGKALYDNFTFALYRWSVSTVMSRQNMIPKSNIYKILGESDEPFNPDVISCLIPFWDMANHKNGQLTTFYNIQTEQMESCAMEACKENDQVFIHYGARSNGEYLIHNGFLDFKNPNDFVKISLGLNKTDHLYAKRLELLKRLNLQSNNDLKVQPPPNFISSEMLAFVRIFNMNEEQLAHWTGSDRAEGLLHMDCALETSLETKTWEYLHVRFMLLLRNYPTTLEADEETLAKQKSGEIEMSDKSLLMLNYRIMEKRILVEAYDYVKEHIRV